MSKGIRFTDEFKQDAMAQIFDRGYAVSEVAQRLGISIKSLNYSIRNYHRGYNLPPI